MIETTPTLLTQPLHHASNNCGHSSVQSARGGGTRREDSSGYKVGREGRVEGVGREDREKEQGKKNELTVVAHMYSAAVSMCYHQ